MALERRWRCALAASAFNSAVWAASSRTAFTTAADVAVLQAQTHCRLLLTHEHQIQSEVSLLTDSGGILAASLDTSPHLLISDLQVLERKKYYTQRRGAANLLTSSAWDRTLKTKQTRACTCRGRRPSLHALQLVRLRQLRHELVRPAGRAPERLPAARVRLLSSTWRSTIDSFEHEVRFCCVTPDVHKTVQNAIDVT